MADDLEADDLAYLAPDFDPATLTMPRLRSILVAHNVSYLSSAKKSQLLDLFNEHVVPQAKKILSARARVRRTTKGIEDMESSQEVDMRSDDREEDSNDLATRTPRRRRKEADDETEPPRTKSPRKRAAPKPATRKTNSEEASLPPPDTEKKRRSPTKKRLVSTDETPQVAVKVEEDAPKPLYLSHKEEDSPFSTDNPFQSGSSPLAAALSPSDELRRRTVDPSDTRERSKKRVSSSRRKTDLDGANDTFAIPNGRTVARLKKEPSPDGDAVAAGEEFTPEEQLELAEEQAASGEVEVRPAKRQRQAKASGSGIGKAAAWAIPLAMLGGLGTVWRQEKIEVGFCGVGRQPSAQLAGVEIPEWASAIQPQCEPCPAHAFCYADFQAACESDFVLVPHPLSVGGLVPLPPTCEPDGEKARKVKAVADRAVEELRERNAKYECGEPVVDEEGVEQRVTSPEIEETELKQQVSDKRRKGMTQDEFEDLWQSAIGEILTRDEVTSSPDGNQSDGNNGRRPGVRLLRSQSLANVSILCAARHSVRVALVRHIWKLVSVGLLALSLGYARWSIVDKRKTEAKAKQLASFALDRLATQAAASVQEPGRAANPWISMGQLRDDILRDEFSTWRRQKLWTKVQKKVEHNSNVRSAVKEDNRSGEVGRVWEWIGALPVLDDGRGPSRRQSSRYSLGSPFGGSSPADQSSLIQQQRSAKSALDAQMEDRGNWNEHRPIY